MIHFILGSMDGDNDAAVLAVPVDFSKAFNRMLHSDMLCYLDALNVPKCATKLIKSYLTRRTMCVKYKGKLSSFQSCPGGGPQGGLLTGVLFIIQVNKAGSPCISRRMVKDMETAPWMDMRNKGTTSLEVVNNCSSSVDDDNDSSMVPNGEDESAPRLEVAQQSSSEMEGENESTTGLEVEIDPSIRQEAPLLPLCHQQSKLHKKSFIDDLTLLEKISLSNLIVKNRIIGPLNYHDRFNLTMPNHLSILQHQLEDLQIFTKEHHMKLNSSKTKCMPFVNSLTKDFEPQLTIEKDRCLEVIYKLKLVGLVITSDLSWNSHVEYTIGRVNKILWQITRFKRLGAPRVKLITLYIIKVRSVLMFGAASFHSSLSQELSRKLELQQKKALAIILGSQYKNYNNALALTQLPRLDTFRKETCLQWAIKAQLNPKHTDLFPLRQTEVNTRNSYIFREYFCRTTKYYNGAMDDKSTK